MIAAQKGHKEVVEALPEHEKGMSDNQNHTALYHALKNGHTEVAKVIVPHEDPTDENNVTALMRAAARGDAEMVELLAPLQKGMKDKDGNAALVHALGTKHEGIALLLSNTNHAPFREVLGAKQSSRARSPSASNKPIAILLLGETGVGKATSVSGTINYLRLDRLPRPPRRSAGYSGRRR